MGDSAGAERGGSQDTGASRANGPPNGRRSGMDASGAAIPVGSGIKAGDLVQKVTSVLGIPTCGGCAKRREAMNRVDLSKPAFEVLSGLLEAIKNPEKALDNGNISPQVDRTEKGRT